MNICRKKIKKKRKGKMNKLFDAKGIYQKLSKNQLNIFYKYSIIKNKI